MDRKEMLGVLAVEQAQQSFVKSWFTEATDEEKVIEGLAILVSSFFKWDGIRILKMTSLALTDANFHTEAEAIDTMIEKIEKDIEEV